MAGLTTFFGRDAELAALVDAVTAHRLVTVTGPGGVGKSRLVAEARPRFEEMFDDGVRAVSVAELDEDPEPLTVSGRLGMRSPEAVAVSLGDAPALLVLDGCDQAADTVGRFVARVLATSDTARVVVTSREPLGIDGEHLLPVAPLPVPSLPDADPEAAPAVALFLDRARAAGAAWDADDETLATVVELCRRVDALPLAIELAAARARSSSPLDLLALMDRRLDVLRARHPDRATGPGSVRAAIDVSVDLLDAGRAPRSPPSGCSRARSTSTSPTPSSPAVATGSRPSTCSTGSSTARSSSPIRRRPRPATACSSSYVNTHATSSTRPDDGTRRRSG